MADDMTDNQRSLPVLLRMRTTRRWVNGASGQLAEADVPDRLCAEAADELDRLRAQVAALEAERDALIRDIEGYVKAASEQAADILRLEAENAALLNRCGEEQAAAADGDALARALRAENARMRERENAACNLAEVAMSEAARVAAERDALRADAERYRWLRSDDAPGEKDYPAVYMMEDKTWPLLGEGLDAAVDAARGAEGAAR